MGKRRVVIQTWEGQVMSIAFSIQRRVMQGQPQPLRVASAGTNTDKRNRCISLNHVGHVTKAAFWMSPIGSALDDSISQLQLWLCLPA